MKAAVYTKRKSGKVLEIVEVEAPFPKENEVLIRVRAAAVNPLDWRLKSKRPGIDVAGEVEAVGQKVTHFRKGDVVFGLCKGAFAEYACASAAEVVVKPKSLTFEQAAAIPIAGLTALQGLRDIGRLQPGQKVLINGAAGGVGIFAVQIAKALGAHVTGVCSISNVEQTLALGADRVIDYTRDDFTKDNVRYDLLLDNVGNRTLSDIRRVLAPRGRCAMVGVPKEMRAVSVRLVKAFVWSPFLRQKFTFFFAKRKSEDLMTLCEMMKAGKVTPVIDRQYSLAQTGEAISYVETGHARAKVVIVVE